MKLIKPYAEIWEQNPGILGIYEQIERCARVCYKSEDKIGEDTAEKMINMLKERKHGAALEHGTVYLKIDNTLYDSEFNHDAEKWNSFIRKYQDNTYSKVANHEYTVCITANYRVLIENNWLDDLKYLCEPTEYHEKRITVHWVTDRGISHEIVRHRKFSFSQESTRYCNYSKSKFSKEVTFIIPCWFEVNMLGNPIADDNECLHDFRKSLELSESYYLTLLGKGWTPQQARAVLPNALKTEVCMTGFMSDWEHFFKLRCDKAAHPQMRELAIPLQKLIMG